ncbi:MAG TPA: hypothetical protein VK509_00755, partial [Polyangiales bacterium]|nr:hypothetical protein [Polyangiales bacterium]
MPGSSSAQREAGVSMLFARAPIFACAAILVLIAGASLVRADDRPSLGVELVACERVDREAVFALVALELGARTAPLAEVPAHATRVTARCDSGSVLLEVIDPLTRKTVARTIALEPVALSARARVLAIAIAELVSASWFELERARKPEPAQFAAQSAAPPALVNAERAAALRSVAARSRAWRASVGLGPTLRLASAAPGRAWGGTLQLAAYSPDSPVLLLDLNGWYAQSELELGSASALSFSLGATGLLSAEAGSWTLLAGAGGRLGWARVRGRSADDSRARAGE